MARNDCRPKPPLGINATAAFDRGCESPNQGRSEELVAYLKGAISPWRRAHMVSSELLCTPIFFISRDL